MRLRAIPFFLSMCLMPAGCVHTASAPAPAASAPALIGDSAHPARAQGWVDAKLYFGLGPADRPEQGVSEAAWRAFLDKEVTPRFPAGLSVLDVYGQWESQGSATVERLRSKLLVIECPNDAGTRAKLDAIRAAWKQETGDQSVLMVITPADVSF